MTDRKFVLGIDTSNYKTSIAIVGMDEIVTDIRRLLHVKKGERGLRQSEALFQHIKNLPELFEEAGSICKGSICAVSYSGKPRSVEGSYMPCFLAGSSFAKSTGSLLGIPAMEFSHQDGHIEAVRWGSGFSRDKDFLACHFSGGTCEVLKIKQNSGNAGNGSGFFHIEIIGGSKDISFGQVIDRAGVSMGFSFPCGEEMDSIAFETEESSNVLTPVKVNLGKLNLSGIDTQISLACCKSERDMLIREIFDRLSDAMVKMLTWAAEATDINDILMSGGVSSSRYIRKRILEKSGGLNIIFDNSNLSSDNAVGTALLGGRVLWD